MEIWQAVILGVVEGVTEFLPISSTGHLIIAGELLHLPETNFLKTFDIAIQLGAILAVVALYWRSFLSVPVLKKLFIAFLPTGIIGFTLYPLIKGYLLGNMLVVILALGIGGVLLILFELWHREKETAVADVAALTYKQSFLIGLAQSVAVIPGVSRSAATILGGLSLGVSRVAIVEFSFLLAVPTMAAATGYDLLKNVGSFNSGDLGALVVGFIVSFVVALVAIKWLLAYVRGHSFIGFGIYRIGIALVLFGIFFLL